LTRGSLGGCAVENETQTGNRRDSQDRVTDYMVATCRFPLLSNHVVDRTARVIGHRSCPIRLMGEKAVRGVGSDQRGWHAQEVIGLPNPRRRPVRRTRCQRVACSWRQGAASLQPRSGTDDEQDSERPDETL